MSGIARMQSFGSEIQTPEQNGNGVVDEDMMGSCAGMVQVEGTSTDAEWSLTKLLAMVAPGTVSISDDDLRFMGDDQALNPGLPDSNHVYHWSGNVPGARCASDSCASCADTNTLGVLARWEKLAPPDSKDVRVDPANVHFHGRCSSRALPGTLALSAARFSTRSVDIVGEPQDGGWLLFRIPANLDAPGARLLVAADQPLRCARIQAFCQYASWCRYGNPADAVHSCLGSGRIAVDRTNKPQLLGYHEGGLLIVQWPKVTPILSSDAAQLIISQVAATRDLYALLNIVAHSRAPHAGSVGLMVRAV